jgi:hypothetical protein
LPTYYTLYALNIPFRAKKNKIDMTAPAGKVIIQDRKILLITLKFSDARPLAIPTPRTAPTRT